MKLIQIQRTVYRAEDIVKIQLLDDEPAFLVFLRQDPNNPDRFEFADDELGAAFLRVVADWGGLQ